jgi:hypothetical protein
VWPGELDLCPDELYLQVTGRQVGHVFPDGANRCSHG